MGRPGTEEEVIGKGGVTHYRKRDSARITKDKLSFKIEGRGRSIYATTPGETSQRGKASQLRLLYYGGEGAV